MVLFRPGAHLFASESGVIFSFSEIMYPSTYQNSHYLRIQKNDIKYFKNY